MQTNEIYEYNHYHKKLNGVFLISFLIFAAITIAMYLFYFSKLHIFQGTVFETMLIFFKNELANYTLLGVFMLAFIGGLFFVPLPMEVLFAAFIAKNPSTLYVFLLYMAGLTIGYTTNLFIGYRFSNFARKVISTKKFYQIKSTINRYGKYAVFFSNVVLFPSQQVSFILGVFKYNKYKFWTQFLAGQIIKLLAITGFVLLFK